MQYFSKPLMLKLKVYTWVKSCSSDLKSTVVFKYIFQFFVKHKHVTPFSRNKLFWVSCTLVLQSLILRMMAPHISASVPEVRGLSRKHGVPKYWHSIWEPWLQIYGYEGVINVCLVTRTGHFYVGFFWVYHPFPVVVQIFQKANHFSLDLPTDIIDLEL